MTVDGYEFSDDLDGVDLDEPPERYRIAPLGIKPADALRVVFGNSRYRCFVRAEGALVGAGGALAAGLGVAYVADVAVHPDHQGRGLGRAIVAHLVSVAAGHKKIL